MNKLTKEQAAIIGAYTGVLCGEFSDMHEYIEKKMGRPVFVHEMASDSVVKEIRDATRDDFLAVCAD